MTRIVSCTALVCVLAVSTAFAQDPTGGVEGRITDKTAAVVASAHVVVRSLETGLSRDANAGADGFYRVRALPVGTYVLTVDAPQFATFVQQPIQVNVNEVTRVDVALGLAGVAESVSFSICRSTAATSRSSACCKPGSRRSRRAW